ncbi:MAG: helix-turn-helix domain-containing protein [Planctomycetota bacterium]
MMRDTELYTKLLGIQPPWQVMEVRLNLADERVDVWVEEEPKTRFPCAVCGGPAPVYDHTEEQVWRHLDTCHCATFLHARLPPTNCATHGVRQIRAPWAEPRSDLTLRLEARLIDVLKECDVSGVTRLMGTGWDQT